MKAAIFYGPGDIRVEEIVKPVPAKGEVLIKVEACAICGTDIRIYKSGHSAVTPPHIIGHEISGIIESYGTEVKGLEVGDKVAITTEIGCGYCNFCLDGKVNLCTVNRRAIGYFYPGGFSEYMIIPHEAVLQGNIIKLDESADLDEMALVEPLACVINSHELMDVNLGDTVLIMGAGPIGCMHIELSRMKGACKIIIVDLEQRLKVASVFNPDHSFKLENADIKKELFNVNNNKGANIVITACSSPEAQKLALELVGVRGRICFFGGLPKGTLLDGIDSNVLHYKEVKLVGSFSSNRRHSFTAINLIQTGRISASKYITQRFVLDNILDGFNKVTAGEALKVIIKP